MSLFQRLVLFLLSALKKGPEMRGMQLWLLVAFCNEARFGGRSRESGVFGLNM
jgi:hypothetical protein